MNLDYWFVFPCAVLVAVIANASGFSGGVLFQPFFNFVLQLPLQQSIATGIGTETIGMSSGAYRYRRMKQIDGAAVRTLLPVVALGVLAGLFIFSHAPRVWLRLIVGLVVGGIALYQLILTWFGRRGAQTTVDLAALRRHRWMAFVSGVFSACTGTGVAELHQPLLERTGRLATIGNLGRHLIPAQTITISIGDNEKEEIRCFLPMGMAICASVIGRELERGGVNFEYAE